MSLGLSGAAVLIAAVVVLGWIRGDAALASFFGHGAPVNFGAACGFLILGLAILGDEYEHAALARLAALASVLGAAALAFSFAHAPLHFEALLGANGATIPSLPLHPVASLSLFLGGAVVAWRSTQGTNRARIRALVLTSSFMSSAGFSTLLGYWVGLPAVYHWGAAQPLPIASACMLVGLGTSILLVAWREQQREESGLPPWLPMPVVIASTTLTLILWLGLREAETARTATATQLAMRDFASAVQRELDKDMDEMERFATRLSESENVTAEEWRFGARALRVDLISDPAILQLDSHFHPERVEPAANAETLALLDQSFDPVRATLTSTLPSRGRAEISPALHPSATEVGFAIYAPVWRGAELTGYTAAEFSYPRFLAGVARTANLARDYGLAVFAGNEAIFHSVSTEELSTRDRLEEVFPIADRPLRIELTPTLQAVGRSRRYLPELALGAGCGITLLLGLSLHLARAARASLQAAEVSYLKLQIENEQRRRIEQRLKVSEEQLRLALDSTLVGIFELNIPANVFYGSPGLWMMLGYAGDAIPSTLEGWLSLIHLDDVAAYRAILEKQLSGAAAFIDPEYRIRAASGEFRWLYARSKTVASSADGKAERVVGTVQDVTGRKRAEEALLVSQAATRKLSLVASRTDNLVIIAAPDGTIEWVNESFARVMEYELGEIAGRSPMDFMVGPETRRRTVQRIRSAMRRGEGISTDIINYSKSGKKFHLHLEVQPVHNESGELENFIAILFDISARVETENNLRRAKSEADAASRAKSEFLASMSHEIRTPMNGVIGMTSLLLDTPLTPEQRDYVNTIRNSGDALLTIINEILDFSKIESGKMELENLPFELAVCVEDSLDLFSGQAAEKNLELVYHVAPDVPMWVQGDVTRLRQVLANLINNAVKFTSSGSIAVKVRGSGISNTPDGRAVCRLHFDVSDTGIGIPSDRLDRLFRPFSQVDSSTTRKYGGTGLGLAICHRLCTLMGGEIGVTSSVGVGSTFSFSIVTEPVNTPTGWGLPDLPARLGLGEVLVADRHPVTRARIAEFLTSWGMQALVAESAESALARLARAPAPVAMILDARLVESADDTPLRECVSQSDIPTVLLLSTGANAQLSAFTGRRGIATASKPLRTQALIRALQNLFEAPPDSLPPFVVPADSPPLAREFPLEILLVEDNAINQKVALRFLDRLGYRADAVAGGIEALNTLAQRNYQLVLLDLQMPDMDGFETAREIRRRVAAEKQPKIIALTANALQGDREVCLAAGMDDYITKPVKLLDIVQVIRRQFTRSSAPPLNGKLS